MPSLKTALREGRAVFGTWLNSPSPSQAEIIGYAGFDFVMLDTEHASYDIAGTENLIRAAHAASTPALVRVAGSDSSAIGRVLDYGAEGVMVPHTGSAASARLAVAAAHYRPLGERGAAPTVRAARYGHLPWPEHLARAAAETLVIVQIEGQEGIANLPQIMAVPGVDVLFIGPFDLSQALGVSGQLDHPLLLETVGSIVQQARGHGLAVGIWMPTAAQVRPWLAQGVQLITVANSDLLFYDACRQVIQAARATDTGSTQL
jgi:4-hydroxy-2-oxoheptanedioate aldolase